MSSEACNILPTYTKKPKKRPRQPEQWTRNAMKAKRAKGESYTRADGTVVAARKAGSPAHVICNALQSLLLRKVLPP